MTTFIIVVSGVNVFAHKCCTGDPGSGIEHKDSTEWLAHLVHFPTEIHNGLKEVHAPTARFVSKHPPQESLSNCRQNKQL